MNNRIDWRNDRIDLKKMGRKWAIANWCLVIFGIITGTFTMLGSSVFHLPALYMLLPGFVFVAVFIVYAMTMLIAFARNKRKGLNGDGTPFNDDTPFHADGYATIDDTKHVTTFKSPAKRGERWQYGVIYLGFAIWLFKSDYDLIKATFLENHHPMAFAEYVMSISALVTCTIVPIMFIVIALKQFIPPAQKDRRTSNIDMK